MTQCSGALLPDGQYRAGGNGSNGTSSTGDTGDTDETTDDTTGDYTSTGPYYTTGTTDGSPPTATASETMSGGSDSTGGTGGSSSTDGSDPTSPTDSDEGGSSSSSGGGGDPPETVPFKIDVKTKSFIGPLSWSGYGNTPGFFPNPLRAAAFRALGAATDVSYNENPVQGHLETGEFRLYSDLFVTGKCEVGTGRLEIDGLVYPVDDPANNFEPDIIQAGGPEAGPIYGVLNPTPWAYVTEDDGVGYTKVTIRYVISGHPNPVLEGSFQGVWFRLRRDIWHKISVELTCNDDGTLHIVRRGWRSKFPSVRTWIYQDGDKLINQVRTGVQGPFSGLWSLEPFPPREGVS